jgi:hypothetical protein
LFCQEICTGLRIDQIIILISSLESHKGKIDPRAYKALLENLDFLKYCAHFGKNMGYLMSLKKLFPNRMEHFCDLHQMFNLYLLICHNNDLKEEWKKVFASCSVGKPISSETKDLIKSFVDTLKDKFDDIVDFIEKNPPIFRKLLEFIKQASLDGVCLRVDQANTDYNFPLVKGSSFLAVKPELRSVVWDILRCMKSILDPSTFELSGKKKFFQSMVILQRTIGEIELGDPIPVSGIMLIQERSEQSLPTIIYSTYGHGEGILGGHVACDRILLLPSGETVKSISKKIWRIGPAEEWNEYGNAREFRDQCSLSDEMLAQLKEIKNTVTDKFHTDMEIEFVTVGSFVHIVQARPINESKSYFSPSYLHLSDDEKGCLYPCEVLSAGESKVLKDLDTDVIFANDVDNALDAYLSGCAKTNINAIFVVKMEDNSSHTISFFQRLKIPVVAFPEALKLSDTKNMVLCTQRGIVKVGGDDAVEIQGWHSHPVSGVITLERPEIAPFSSYYSDDVRLEPISQLIESLKSRNPDVVRYAFDSLLYMLQKFVKGPLKGASPKLQEKVKTLALQVFQFGMNAYNYSVDSRKMEQLLAVKFVEARLKTPFESRHILERDGFDQLAGKLRLQQQAVQELGEVILDPQIGEQALKLFKVGRFILNENVRKSWLDLLKNIFEMENKFYVKALVRLIHKLAEKDFLSLFMNSTFPELLQKRLSTKEVLCEMLEIVHDKSGLFRDLENLYDYQIKVIAYNKGLVALKRETHGPNKRFVETCTPLFEMQSQLSALLSEVSAHSLMKLDDNNRVVSLKSFLDIIEQYWIRYAKLVPTYSTADFKSIFIEKNRLGSPLEYMLNDVPRCCFGDLFRENCNTLINVLRNQFSPILPQILTSKVGPLVQSLLQLPIPDPDQQRVPTFVHATIDYPWLQLQMNLLMKSHSSTIDIRYHMTDHKVELQFKMFSYRKLILAQILAFAATDALKGLSFAKNKTPTYDDEDHLYTFTWSVKNPQQPTQTQVLANNLQQYLMRILYSCSSEPNDERFISTLSNRHMDAQSIFEMVQECYRLVGKRKNLVDFLSILPSDSIEKLILDFAKAGPCEAVFELLDPTCVRYLKNERKILNDKSIIALLMRLMNPYREEIKGRIKECVERLYSFETLREIIEDECNSNSWEVQERFVEEVLPLFANIFPALYSHYKQYVINYYLNKNYSIGKGFESQCLSYHLNQWSTNEFLYFLNFFTEQASRFYWIEIGQLVPYLMYPGMVNELKKYVVKNGAWNAYLKGLLKEYSTPSEYASQFPDEQVSKTRIEQEISNFPTLAKTCDASSLLTCISYVPTRIELIESLQQYLTKEAVEKNRNKKERYHVEQFFDETLPTLYKGSTRWLELYRQELLNLIQPSSGSIPLFKGSITNGLAAMIADLIQSFNTKNRAHCYNSLIQDKRGTGTYNSDPICMSYLNVLLSCKDTEMQEEMITFLVEQDRWDLMWRGAWNLKSQNKVVRDSEQENGRELLRQRFDSERIQKDWGKVLGWHSWMPCAMMSDRRLKETAFILIFNDLILCRIILSQLANDSEFKDEEKLDFLSHLGALDDHMIKKFIDSLSKEAVSELMQMICLEKESDTIWWRFVPFLRGLPQKLPELPQYFKGNSSEISDEQATKMFTDLGWTIPADEE